MYPPVVVHWWYKEGTERERRKMTYQIGDTVELLNIQRPPIEGMARGVRGTVRSIDPLGAVIVRWDGLGSVRMVPGRDEIAKITVEDMTNEFLREIRGMSAEDREAVAEYMPMRRVCQDCYMEVSELGNCNCEG